MMVSDGNVKAIEEWIIDSGCTFHIYPNLSWFHTYEQVSEGVVMMRNNVIHSIVGEGIIRIHTHDGVT